MYDNLLPRVPDSRRRRPPIQDIGDRNGGWTPVRQQGSRVSIIARDTQQQTEIALPIWCSSSSTVMSPGADRTFQAMYAKSTVRRRVTRDLSVRTA